MSRAFYLTAWFSLLMLDSTNSKFTIDNHIKFLEELGIRTWDLPNSRAELSKSARIEDSPIYYIKSVPMQKLFTKRLPPPQLLSRPQAIQHPFHHIKLQFLNNGKPEHLYHWKYKPTLQLHHQPLILAPPHHYERRPPSYITNEIYNPQKIPILTSNPYSPITHILQKPISIKDYLYNGKPTNVYVFKPRRQVKADRYKHAYFKHFNY